MSSAGRDNPELTHQRGLGTAMGMEGASQSKQPQNRVTEQLRSEEPSEIIEPKH